MFNTKMYSGLVASQSHAEHLLESMHMQQFAGPGLYSLAKVVARAWGLAWGPAMAAALG